MSAWEPSVALRSKHWAVLCRPGWASLRLRGPFLALESSVGGITGPFADLIVFFAGPQGLDAEPLNTWEVRVGLRVPFSV